MDDVAVHIATEKHSQGKPLLAVSSGNSDVRIPAQTEGAKLNNVHPCDGVDEWIVVETVVLNSDHALRDFLYNLGHLGTRKKLVGFI